MAINYDDIKLMQSQVLNDSAEGGGMMTGNEVVDGEMNNLFPDISRLDRTYGRVQLRKAFPAVLTSNRNPYYGAHIIFTKPAKDTNVKCCLFTTKNVFDTRATAVDRLEQYVTQGYRLFSYVLLGKHVVNVSGLLVRQDKTDELPRANEVFYICESDGSNGEYIKVKEVKIKKETTSTRELELTLWAPTQYVHAGLEFVGNTEQIKTYFYKTLITDAVKYYSISKLATPAFKGDRTIKVQSIFHQLVPVAQSQTGLSDKALPLFGKIVAGNTQPQTLANLTINTNVPFSIYCLRAITEGTLQVQIGSYTYADDKGLLKRTSTGAIVGSVSYAEGIVKFTTAPGLGNATVTVNAIPGTLPSRPVFAIEFPVTVENRRSVFVLTCVPPIVPGSVVVRYMAEGNWYTLRDDGNGGLAGAVPAHGAGVIDYNTSTINVTIGALPDINSSVIFMWATAQEYVSKGGTQSSFPYIELKFSDNLVPGTLTINYTAGNTQKTVYDNQNGQLTGDGSGRVYYAQKRIELYPSALPDVGTSITLSYYKSASKQTITIPLAQLTDNGTTFTASLNNTIVAGSLQLTIKNLTVASGTALQESFSNLNFYDNGNGALQNVENSQINYQNGTVTFPKVFSLSTYAAEWEKSGWTAISSFTATFVRTKKITNFTSVGYSCAADATNEFTFSYLSATGSDLVEEEITSYTLRYDLDSLKSHSIIPNSILINNWIDKDGIIYDGIDYTNGSIGNPIGTIDYDKSYISLASWTSGGQPSRLTLRSAVLAISEPTVCQAVFTTNGAPIQVGSFQLLFTRADTGEQVSVIADMSGNINANGVVGKIDYETGIVHLNFGIWVPKAGNENQNWYDASLTSGDQVLKPIPVYSNSIRYNCVLINYIPLEPSILGLNPLRLPTDGRVTIFKPGYVVVIHNTQEYTLPNNLQPGQVITLPRDDLSYVDIFDQNGKYVPKNLYSVNLATGIITMADPLDLSSYVQPLVAYHRREDMRLLTDVDIDGTLSLIQPIEHDYDTDYTYVSSALLMGDLYASVYNVFDQKTWTGVWSDTLIGEPCSANYDILHYPIEITNKGALAERWAIVFTSSTTFKVIGQNVGEIATGNTSQDCAPVNPATDTPYFVIRAAGWGSGWSTNNVLRFNTTAAHYPVWFVRTILIGNATDEDDNFKIQIRGDAD